MDNKKQKNYIKLIQEQKPNNSISLDETTFKEMFNKFANEKKEEAILNLKSDINILINNFCNYINYKGRTLKNAKAELTPLSDYLKGNGKEYLAKSCEDLTNERKRTWKFNKWSNPKNRQKKYTNANLFDLVEFRKKDPSLKPYANNTILGMEAQIKKILEILCKTNRQNPRPPAFRWFQSRFH